jgi:hypothetical protein
MMLMGRSVNGAFAAEAMTGAAIAQSNIDLRFLILRFPLFQLLRTCQGTRPLSVRYRTDARDVMIQKAARCSINY